MRTIHSRKLGKAPACRIESLRHIVLQLITICRFDCVTSLPWSYLDYNAYLVNHIMNLMRVEVFARKLSTHLL